MFIVASVVAQLVGQVICIPQPTAALISTIGSGSVHPINIRGGNCFDPHPATSIDSSPTVRLLQPDDSNRDGDSLRLELTIPDAEFVVFRFAHLQLPPSSRLVISSGVERALSSTHGTYRSHVIQSTPGEIPVRFSPPMYAPRVLLEYFDDSPHAPDSSADAVSLSSCFGFYIDQYRDHALLPAESSSATAAPKTTKCPSSVKNAESNSIDEMTESASSLLFDTDIFHKTLSTVRILVQKPHGAVACSGFVVGCSGHVLTNSHCVSTEEEAVHSTIEFSDSTFTATDSFEAITGAQLVASSPQAELDYALLLPWIDEGGRRRLLQRFGFLSLRTDGARQDERIFIPQFPGSTEGTGALDKRVAIKSYTKHGSSFGHVTSLSTTSCNGRNDSIGYTLATSGGSSGAPVIAYQDMAVVGLHYCASGCKKSATPSRKIVQDLKRLGHLPPCAELRSSLADQRGSQV